MKKIFISIVIGLTFFAANVVFAEVNTPATYGNGNSTPCTNCNLNYTPLEPLPGGFSGAQTGDLAPYLRSGFQLAILLGGLTAVIILIFGGIGYMVSEVSPSGKAKAKKRIIGAIWGLLILLGSYLLLNTINPQLVNFKTLFLPTEGLAGGGQSGITAAPGAGGGATGGACGATGPGTCQDTQCRQSGPGTTCPVSGGSLDVAIDGSWICACN